MATSYKIRLKRFNGTDYDTLNLVSQNVIMSSGNDLQTDFTNLDNSIDDIVYVGETTPTDPDTKIWLDTDSGGASAVNSINGKAGTVVLDADDVGAMSKWVLLWTNASPTSTFGAQTIPLDLSDYDAIVVTSKHWTDNDARRNEIAFVGSSRMILTVQSPTNIKIQTLRLYSVSTTGVTFEGGKGTNDSLGTYDSNYAIIPLAIYGIKGVQTS